MAWNRGRLVSQKRPLQPKQVWSIRARLELAGNLRNLALFNLTIDSTLRCCDLVLPRGSKQVVGDPLPERPRLSAAGPLDATSVEGLPAPANRHSRDRERPSVGRHSRPWWETSLSRSLRVPRQSRDRPAE
jgi:hypothetical protein